MVARGDVWLVALDPAVGSEIQKTRPCVVVSPVIVAPMTTAGRAAPFRVPLTFLRKKGLILLDQIRTVDKTRLVKRAGAVSDTALSNALSTLQEIFVE